MITAALVSAAAILLIAAVLIFQFAIWQSFVDK